MIQVLTGVLLLLYYTPSIDAAHESIVFIMSQIRFGWLIRSVHSWTANILIGAIFVHMFSSYFLKAYRPPRELTWVTGFFLLVIFLAFGFSGYLLPWNELSFFATKVGTDIAGVVPLVGKSLKAFILGGSQVSGATLTRFFWLHVAILPLFTLGVLGVHLLLVQILGMSKPIGIPRSLGPRGVLLSRFPDQRLPRLDPHPRSHRCPLCLSSLGGRTESRRIRGHPLGNSARMVFYVHVHDAQAHPISYPDF